MSSEKKLTHTLHVHDYEKKKLMSWHEATELDVRATQIGESIWGEGYNNGLAVSRLEWKQKIQELIEKIKANLNCKLGPNIIRYNVTEQEAQIDILEKLLGDQHG